MGGSKGLDKQDSDEIGFVIAALFCSALSLDELHKWCFELISAKNPAELPSYIFDLADFKGPPADVFNTIGFAPQASTRLRTAGERSGFSDVKKSMA